MDPAIPWNGGIITRAEVDARIAMAVRATVSSTSLLRQDGHAVNAQYWGDGTGSPIPSQKESRTRMTRLPLWALVPILIVLAACSSQAPIPAATPTSVAATAEPKFYKPADDERHPDSSGSEHTRVHNGGRHADTSILDGNVYPGIDPRTDNRHTYPNDLSCDNCRPNPSRHPGVQPVPMEALDRRGWRLPRRQARGPHLREPG